MLENNFTAVINYFQKQIKSRCTFVTIFWGKNKCTKNMHIRKQFVGIVFLQYLPFVNKLINAHKG